MSVTVRAFTPFPVPWNIDDENIPKIERNLKDALNILRPKRLLVYAGVQGREMIEKFDLPCDLTGPGALRVLGQPTRGGESVTTNREDRRLAHLRPPLAARKRGSVALMRQRGCQSSS